MYIFHIIYTQKSRLQNRMKENFPMIVYIQFLRYLLFNTLNGFGLNTLVKYLKVPVSNIPFTYKYSTARIAFFRQITLLIDMGCIFLRNINKTQARTSFIFGRFFFV